MSKKPLPEKAQAALRANVSGFARKASDVKVPEFLSTGHMPLDLAIAHGATPEDSTFDIDLYDRNNLGGLPMGQLCEFSGGEGSGKSSLAYRVVGYAQKKGHQCLWIDAEHSFSHSLAEVNDVNLDDLLLADLVDPEEPDHIYCAEEIFDQICETCKNGVKVIVLDSVAGLVTKAEFENTLYEGGVGIGALSRALSQGLKKIINYAAKYGVMVIAINQLRENINIRYGNPETTPGGRALKHLASVRVKIQKQTGKDADIMAEDDKGNPVLVGGWSYVYVQKNRHGKPVRGEVKIPILYQHYFPNMEEMVFNEGRKTKVISKRVETFSWDGIKVEGKASFIQAVKDAGTIDKLIAEIQVAAKEEKIILPPEVLYYKPTAEAVDSKVENGDETKVSRRRKTKDSGSKSGESVET